MTLSAKRLDAFHKLAVSLKLFSRAELNDDKNRSLIEKLYVESRVFSATAIRKWYVDRVSEYERSGRRSSREDDYREANEAFGGNIPKRQVEALRRELAPHGWTRQGRPRGPKAD